MAIIVGIFSGLIWACFASFAGVIGERVPAGKSIGGRSVCVCGRELLNSENVPVLGYLSVKGRTSCCNQKLPIRYFLTETFSLLLGFIFGLFIGSAIEHGGGVIVWFIWLGITVVGAFAMIALNWRKPKTEVS